MPPITLPPEIIEKLDWDLNAPGGLYDWVANPANLAEPENNVARDDHRGLTIVEFCQAQIGLFEYVIANNGGNMKSQDMGTNWLAAALVIRDSYNRSGWEVTESVKPGGSSFSRSVFRDVCDELANKIGGHTSDKPTLVTVT